MRGQESAKEAPPVAPSSAAGADDAVVLDFTADVDPEPLADPASAPATATEAAPPPPAASAPAVATNRRLPAVPQGWAAAAGIAAAALLVIVALVLAQGPLLRLFPALAGAYAAIGLERHHDIHGGLEFREVGSSREWAGAEEVLVVKGLVANVRDASRPLPAIWVGLYDRNDVELQAVTVPLPEALLSPGEAIPFEARIANPSLNAHRIRVRFDAPT